MEGRWMERGKQVVDKDENGREGGIEAVEKDGKDEDYEEGKEEGW